MKNLLLSVAVVLGFNVFAQDSGTPNPFETAAEIMVCAGTTQPVQIAVALDDQKSPIAGEFVVIDPQTGAVVQSAELTVSVASYDAAKLTLATVITADSSVSISVAGTFKETTEEGVNLYEATGTLVTPSDTQTEAMVCAVLIP